MREAAETPGRDLRLRSGVDYAFLDRAFGSLANPQRLRLLTFLLQPHYLEEVASHLGVTRQAARKHLDRLTGVGVLERRAGTRGVTEYALNPQALFLLHDEVGKLALGLPALPTAHGRTRVEGAQALPEAALRGPCLLAVGGFAPGKRTALSRATGPPWTLGRDPGCALPIVHDPYVSYRHAEVRQEQGRFVLADLASTNGTHVNWSAVPRAGTAGLAHGDVVGVGRSLFLFWDADR